MSNNHSKLDEQDPADVAIETTSSTWYNFDKMELQRLYAALEAAKEDNTTFSMLNLDGVAIVLPWRIVRSVHAANALEEVTVADGQDPDEARTWMLLWEREAVDNTEPTRVFSEQ